MKQSDVKVVGTVLEEEKNEIETIFERIASLKELCLLFADRKELFDENNHLYSKIIDEMSMLRRKSDIWWQNVAQKNNWIVGSSEGLYIDFSTCEVGVMQRCTQCND